MFQPFINIYDIENGFKIDFRKVWPCLGFSKHGNAKRSLSRNFKEGIDYTCSPSGEGLDELTGLSEDYDPRAEIIMLTFRCSLDLVTVPAGVVATTTTELKINLIYQDRTSPGTGRYPVTAPARIMIISQYRYPLFFVLSFFYCR
jgi:hypothetical protein